MESVRERPMPPKVSILIPAYNAEAWIADTIRSAIGQTCEPKEIIVVDDGSTDQTFAVARQFASENVRVVTQPNQGAAAARNKALSLSTGDYVQWLDADDILASDKIALQLAGVGSEDRKILLSSSWGRFIHRPSRAQFIPNALWCDLSPAEFLRRKLELRVFMQTAVWLVSRELCDAAGPWDTNMISDDDGEYFCRVLRACAGIRFVQGARVYYRTVGPMRLSHVGQSNRKIEALWGSMKLHIGYLRGLEDSAKTRAACVKYMQNYLINFYPQRPDIIEQMRTLAGELGGQLSMPSLSWKYRWIQQLLGWDFAKRAQFVLRNVKWSLIVRWDKSLFQLESMFRGHEEHGVRAGMLSGILW